MEITQSQSTSGGHQSPGDAVAALPPQTQCPTASFSMLAQLGAEVFPQARLGCLPALRGSLPRIWHRARPNSVQRGGGSAEREIPGRGGEHSPSMERGRGAWSQCHWTHLPIPFPPLVPQGLVSPCSALAALHPCSPRMPRRVFAHPHTVVDPSPPEPVQAYLQAAPVCSQGATQMGVEQTVLPTPRPGEHQGSGHV